MLIKKIWFFWTFLLLLIIILFLIIFLYIEKINFFNTTLFLSPCKILPKKYCHQAKLVTYNNKIIGLGFKVKKGTPIYAPFSGSIFPISYSFGNSQDSQNSGLVISMGDFNKKEEIININIFAYLSKVNNENNEKSKIIKGEIIGYVDDDQEPILEDYNLILGFNTYNYETNKRELSNTLMAKYFSDFKE